MLSKISAISLIALGAISFVSANDTATTTATVTVTAPATTTTVISQCNTGSEQCCNMVTQSTSGIAGTLESLLGIVVGDIDGLIGINCSPITAIGLGGSECNQQAVCCTNVQFSGLINLGCTALNL